MFGGFKNFVKSGSSGDIVSYVGLVGGQEFRNELSKIDRSVQKTGAQTTRMGQLFKKSAKIATLALTGIMIASTAMAANFEAKMANVHTLLDVSDKQFKQLSDGVVDVSTRVGKSASGLSVALYDLVSAGVASGDSLSSLEIAARAATAGVTDTQTAVRAGMVIINSYALGIKDLNKVYDLQFKTVKKGVLTFEQYANSIGTVVPQATALGVSLEGLHAAIAVLTKSGQSAAMATTNLSRMFQGLVEKQQNFKDLGIQIFNVDGKFRGILPIVKDLSERLGGLTDEAKQAKLQMLGLDIRANRAIIPLINLYNTTGGLVDTFGEMTDSAGAMGEAFAKIEKSTKHQFELLKANIGAAAIEIGNELLPYLNEVIADFKTWVSKIRESGKLKGIITAIGGGLKTVWEFTKQIGGFVVDHGDLILGLLGALVFTKIVAVTAAFSTNIVTLTTSLKALKTAVAGGWFAKLIASVGAGTAAMASGFVAVVGAEAAALGDFIDKYKGNMRYDLVDVSKQIWKDHITGLLLVQDEWGNWVEYNKGAVIPSIEAVGSKIEKVTNGLNDAGNAAVVSGQKLREALAPLTPDDGKLEYLRNMSAEIKSAWDYAKAFKDGGGQAALLPVTGGLMSISKEKLTDLANAFSGFRNSARDTFNIIMSGADTLADGIIIHGIKVRKHLGEIFRQIARDFMRYFLSEILKMAAMAAVKLVTTFILFDVHENDMKAVKSGLDYAKFFSSGIKTGLSREDLAGNIRPAYRAPTETAIPALAGAGGNQVIRVEVEQVPIPDSKVQAWMVEQNRRTLIPDTDYVSRNLKTEDNIF